MIHVCHDDSRSRLLTRAASGTVVLAAPHDGGSQSVHGVDACRRAAEGVDVVLLQEPIDRRAAVGRWGRQFKEVLLESV